MKVVQYLQMVIKSRFAIQTQTTSRTDIMIDVRVSLESRRKLLVYLSLPDAAANETHKMQYN